MGFGLRFVVSHPDGVVPFAAPRSTTAWAGRAHIEADNVLEFYAASDRSTAWNVRMRWGELIGLEEDAFHRSQTHARHLRSVQPVRSARRSANETTRSRAHQQQQLAFCASCRSMSPWTLRMNSFAAPRHQLGLTSGASSRTSRHHSAFAVTFLARPTYFSGAFEYDADRLKPLGIFVQHDPLDRRCRSSCVRA